MNLEFVESYYRLYLSEEFESIADIKQLLNWISGEFSLHLQENHDGLKVFYPNGCFHMKLKNESKLICDIVFLSRCRLTLNQKLNQLYSVIEHFKKSKRS